MPSVEQLKATANALELTHPTARRLLKDALKGDWEVGTPRHYQEALVRLHEAQQKINEAIALLQKESSIGTPQPAKPALEDMVSQVPNIKGVNPGELQRSAVSLVCQYYGLSKPFVKNGLWYAYAPNRQTPQRLGQHLWLELCRKESLEWIKAQILLIESRYGKFEASYSIPKAAELRKKAAIASQEKLAIR
jgi:hypothetical protein